MSSTTPYATVQDVADELATQIDGASPKGKQIARWIMRAENLIRLHIPLLDEWCDQDPAYTSIVNDVIVNVVARKARNPDGTYSQTVSADDASFTRTMSTSAGSLGEINILEDEWDLLLKRTRGSISSIDPALKPEPLDYPHYPVNY